MESSEDDEEEGDDDDVIGGHERMPEPRVSEHVQPKDPLSAGSGVLPDAPADDTMGDSNGRYIRTGTSGARPSVASQMREMEGRPNQEDDPAIDDERKDGAAETGGSRISDKSGSSKEFLREYMVSASSSYRSEQICLAILSCFV